MADKSWQYADDGKFSVNEMAELSISAGKAGFLPGEFGALANNHRLLRDLRDVLDGHAEITRKTYLLDANLDPLSTDYGELLNYPATDPQNQVCGVREVHHNAQLGMLEFARFGGDLFINGRKVRLDRYRSHSVPKKMSGPDLREWITHRRRDEVSLNASVCQFLVEHPKLVPKSWEGWTLLFPGTTFKNVEPGATYKGGWYIRSLVFDKGNLIEKPLVDIRSPSDAILPAPAIPCWRK